MRRSAIWLALLLAVGCSTNFARRGEPVGRPILLSTAAEVCGQVVYMRHCYSCHQTGEGGLAPVLNLPLPSHAIRTQVRLGVGAMPGFSEAEISDGQLDDLIEYLKAQRRS